MADSERLVKLLNMLEKTPGDAFLNYCAGMEYKKANELDKAVQYYDRTIQADHSYCYAYFQKGQTLELAGDMQGAKLAYEAGITAAIAKGDDHARSELTGALQMVE